MLGRIVRDQLEYYAARTGQAVDATARWLAEHLDEREATVVGQ
jgi:hypothetical protein